MFVTKEDEKNTQKVCVVNVLDRHTKTTAPRMSVSFLSRIKFSVHSKDNF